MNMQSSSVEFARFVSTAAAVSIGVGVSMGGLLVAAVAIFEMAGLQ